MSSPKKMDIHKAGGIIIRNRRLLVERSKGKEHFIAPGGSIEVGETPRQALIRELMEEFQLVVTEDNLEFFGTYFAAAAGVKSRTIQMDVFIVKNCTVVPRPDNEVEEIKWISSDNKEGIKIGSIFEHDVIPKLKEKNLID